MPAEPNQADTTESLSQRVKSFVKTAVAWWKSTRAARALARHSETHGSLLAGGITYTALFSLFAALTITWTGFSWVLRSYPGVQESVLNYIDQALPGLIDLGDGGIVKPDQLILPNVVSWAGAIALVVLLWSAVSCVSALRRAVRTMLGIERLTSMAVGKLRDAATLFVFAFLIFLSALITIGASGVTAWLLNSTGLQGASAVILPVVSIAVAMIADLAIIVLVVKVIAGSHLSLRDMLSGAVVAAMAFTVIRLLGTAVVTQSAATNPVLAPFATIIAVLILVNLTARITLLAAAWMWVGTESTDPQTPALTD